MRINKVTITGADDSVTPQELIEISKRFPFVEWGILVSRNSQGNNRFPSLDWMNNFAELVRSEYPETQLSCHLCGTYVKEVLMGSQRFSDELGKIWQLFNRVQINTHGQRHQFEVSAVSDLKKWSKEIIFQFDGNNQNKHILDFAVINGVNCSTLYDMSHGAGVLPKEWLMPLPNVRCGYAGGLSPDNIKEQLALIESKVGDYELWIDMETQVRSNNDQLFDLTKVVSVLESCEQSGFVIDKNKETKNKVELLMLQLLSNLEAQAAIKKEFEGMIQVASEEAIKNIMTSTELMPIHNRIKELAEELELIM